jgi:hypothetical protein
MLFDSTERESDLTVPSSTEHGRNLRMVEEGNVGSHNFLPSIKEVFGRAVAATAEDPS